MSICQKKLSERARKILFLFNFCRLFFLTLSNKQNKMSGDHDRHTQGGRVVARTGGGEHGRMNKTIPCGGGVPLWGHFSM